MLTYIQALGVGFPNVQASCVGDGSVYDEILWEAGAPLPSKETLDSWIASQEAAPTERKVTVLALRNRFSRTEKINLEMAALDNPAASVESRTLAAALRVDTKDTDSASYIDLNRTDTRSGVQLLETYGLIGVGRALQILDAPIRALELPRD